MINFLKGILVGFGGIAPGLSGTMLLILMGLYRPVLDALGFLFSDFRKKALFLLPVVSGMILGVLMFSQVIDFLLLRWEMPTRFCFLGLILGTVPMLWKEVRQKDFRRWHWLVILSGMALALLLFGGRTGAVPQIKNPNLLQSVFLGFAVALSAIVPGLDPTVLLSSFGLYEAYIGALAVVNLRILAPLAIGLCLGAVGVSRVMSWLLRRFYTPAYCVIFGMFLVMIPNMLNESCRLGFDLTTLVSMILAVLGFLVSWMVGRQKEE